MATIEQKTNDLDTVVVFDIETEPLAIEEVVKVMPKFDAPATIKDPLKAADAIKKKQQDFTDKAALSPYTGKISLISYSVFKKSKLTKDVEAKNVIVGNLKKLYEQQSRMTEKEIISKFFQEIAFNHKYLTLVGFNVKSFDLPFIMIRAIKNGLNVPFFLYEYLQGVKKNDSQSAFKRVIDLMPVCTGFKFGDRISLDNACKFFGIGEKNGNGAFFSEMLKTSSEEAYSYAANDIVLTSKLYSVFMPLIDSNNRSI